MTRSAGASISGFGLRSGRCSVCVGSFAFLSGPRYAVASSSAGTRVYSNLSEFAGRSADARTVLFPFRRRLRDSFIIEEERKIDRRFSMFIIILKDARRSLCPAPASAAIARRTKKAINSLLLRPDSGASVALRSTPSPVLPRPTRCPVFLCSALPRRPVPLRRLCRASASSIHVREFLYGRERRVLVFAPVRDAMPSRVESIDDSIEISLVRRDDDRRIPAPETERESSPRLDPP